MPELKDKQETKKQAIELKGGKSFGPYKYSEEPIDVIMAGKRFQIIRPPAGQFNTRYLLIDPETYNPEDPTTGFKGLWDKQEIVFGRNHPYRFQYTDVVSREHVSIKVDGDNITIRDLNSKNGTTILTEEEPRKTFSGLMRMFTSPKETPKYGTREIFEKAGKRNAKEVLELISIVEQVLVREATKGTGKLGRNIQETRNSPNGNEYFVDGRIAYLPPRGRAVFVGDTHGDSFSTEKIIKQTRFIEEMEAGNKDLHVVFLGDYADRGTNDVRNLEMVLALKAAYPDNVTLMMGNHEEGGGFTPYELPHSLNRRFGESSGTVLHEAYTRLFDRLPNVLVAGNGIVAVHGGIPRYEFPDLKYLRDNEEFFRQIRWNDPTNSTLEFQGNPRGGNIQSFGRSAFERFMGRVGASVMVRSHEYPPEGHELFFNDRLVTIFSNGGNSTESHYHNRVNPKICLMPLDQNIQRIDPRRHIVAI